MADPRTNRFRLDEDDDAPARQAWSSSGGRGPEDTVYLDEPDPRYRRPVRSYRIWVAAGLAALLLLVGGATIYYFVWGPGAGPENQVADPDFERLNDGGEALADRYYVPDQVQNQKLQAAIEMYRAFERDAAKRAFDEFVQSDASKADKSIALIYLGVMALEADRFELAKHHLFRALKYDPESVPALVNLAIAERRLGNYNDAKDYAERARKLAPDDAQAALLLGNILAEGQDASAALDIYEEGIRESPEEPLLYYNTALTLLREQRYEEALLNFSRAAERAGASELAVKSYAHIGQIYFGQGNYPMAADYLGKAVELAPDNGKYLYNLGVVYLRMNREAKAAEHFQRALDAGTNESGVYRALARAFQQMDQPSMAIRALQKGLYLNPEHLPTLFALGDLYYEQEDLLRAAEVYKRIVNITPGDSNTADALVRLAQTYMELERSNDAVDALERAARLDNDNPQVHYLLGLVYDRAGRRELAVQAWKRALERASSGDGPASGASSLSREEERRIRMALADVYRREGAYDLALREYRRIVERNKEAPSIESDPALDLAMGAAYFRLKDYPNAVRFYERVAEARGADAEQRREAFLRLAAAFSAMQGPGDLERARTYANRAVRMDPTDSGARLEQARILLESDSLVDREKAIDVLKAVTRSDVDAGLASEAYNLLGAAYMKNGEYRRALSAFDYAVQLDPSNSRAYQNQRAAANAYEQNL